MADKFVTAVRKLVSILNEDCGVTYREIASECPDVSISSIKQFMAREDVNYRRDSHVVTALSEYVSSDGVLSSIRESGNPGAEFCIAVIEGTDRAASNYDKKVVYAYSIFYQILRVDPSSDQFLNSMSKVAGTYLLRQQSHEKQDLVLSALKIRRKMLGENETNVWEMVHIAKVGEEVRRSDGIVTVNRQLLYMGGDIEEGAGIELIALTVPVAKSSSYLTGVAMSLDLNGRPVCSDVRADKVKDRGNSKLFEDAVQLTLGHELIAFLDSSDIAEIIEKFPFKSNNTKIAIK
jgi:hypothetical protein